MLPRTVSADAEAPATGAEIRQMARGKRRRDGLFDPDDDQAVEWEPRRTHPSSQFSIWSERAGCRPILKGANGASSIRKRRNSVLWR